MSVEYIPVFIEKMIDGIENGAWLHEDIPMAAGIIPRAYTSDLGIFRLRVNDLYHATDIIKENGFIVRHKNGAIEVIPGSSQDFRDIAKLLEENGITVESTAIIPGIYQG
jgi:hypothetical protein